MVSRDDPEPTLRKEALRYIAARPWDVAQPILQRAAAADPDPGVREYAEQTLEGRLGRTMESPSGNFIHDRIARMLDYVVRRSEFSLPDGARIRTVPLADNVEIDEVKHYGDRAIPALSEYLTSEDSSHKNLAMRFLGSYRYQRYHRTSGKSSAYRRLASGAQDSLAMACPGARAASLTDYPAGSKQRS